MADYKSIEVAEKLGITKRMVNIKCQNGDFANAYKAGNRWMIPDADIQEYLIKTGNDSSKWEMDKCFNTTGICLPEKHYMIDISEKLKDIDDTLISKGKYFTINRARQYGKTTTLHMLEKYLSDKYVVVSISFESADDLFDNRNAFAKGLIRKLSRELNDKCVGKAILEKWNSPIDEDFPFESLREKIQKLCESTKAKIVFMIDEVDKSSDNMIFLSFLGLLRDMYLEMQKGKIVTFYSVILAGVYDIKNLKLKLRPDEERKYNSPWNIAADFNINMSFSVDEITKMLIDYSKDKCLRLACESVAKSIYEYTSGYPYLVSRMCQRMDETGRWDKDGIRETVNIIVKEKNTLFDDIAKKLDESKELNTMIYNILFKGMSYPFAIENYAINLGEMFGFIKEENSQVAVANRIFEIWFYNMFMSQEMISDKNYTLGLENRNQFILEDGLNMDLILSKFVEYYSDVFANNTESFIEDNGRKHFLLYLRPIINGTGHYYIEAQTRSMGRTDVIIDYKGKQYIVELKIWHGNQYNEDGEKQLLGYLSDYKVKRGYMLSFNFNKNKKVGIKEHHFKDATIVEAVV